ncbi:hypothetical protein J2W97_002241 [Paenibacillus jamilae]|nr:hypothetical protein [Paenibacillus jamilae]
MSERTVDLIRTDLQSAKNEAKKNILLPVREVSDLLALVDSLQQQTEEYGMTIERQGKEMIRLQGLVNKQLQEVGLFREQMAEKDRTISQIKESKRLLLLVHDGEFARSSEYVQENSKLRKALETATDALNVITNGEWSETIDDEFLEVWTTRRINPSGIADEALFAIGQELEALGRE